MQPIIHNVCGDASLPDQQKDIFLHDPEVGQNQLTKRKKAFELPRKLQIVAKRC